MAKFSKNMTIGEALKINNKVEAVLMGFGMHCFHCPMSQMETLEQAGNVHGVDVDFMVAKLNELQEEKEKKNINKTITKKANAKPKTAINKQINLK